MICKYSKICVGCGKNMFLKRLKDSKKEGYDVWACNCKYSKKNELVQVSKLTNCDSCGKMRFCERKDTHNIIWVCGPCEVKKK